VGRIAKKIGAQAISERFQGGLYAGSEDGRNRTENGKLFAPNARPLKGESLWGENPKRKAERPREKTRTSLDSAGEKSKEKKLNLTKKTIGRKGKGRRSEPGIAVDAKNALPGTAQKTTRKI